MKQINEKNYFRIICRVIRNKPLLFLTVAREIQEMHDEELLHLSAGHSILNLTHAPK